MDLALKTKVEEILGQRPRKHVRVSDTLACIDKESGGVPIFRGTEILFKQNLRAAEKITGLTTEQIRSAMIIQDGPYKGFIAKFRCEPGYWQWAQRYAKVFKPEELLLLSCSFGLGQKMSRWLLTGMPVHEYLPFIRKFMGSVSLQIVYCIGDLDSLLVQSGGNRPLAFTRYNAGPSATDKNPAYKAYGLVVDAKAKKLEQDLKEMK